MRSREKKRMYVESSSKSSESEDYDSSYSDPDYNETRTSSSQRRSRKKFNVNSRNNDPTKSTEVGSSSRSCDTEPIRRRGCPYSGLERECSYASDLHDDACMICADGGELLCCEKCPSTFHPNCLGMENIPRGEWMCPFCICKFCGTGFSGDLHECKQCERRSKTSCPDSPTTFCGKSCEEDKHLGVIKDLGNGFTWSIVRNPDSNALFSHKNTVCNSKVAVAWSVMDEIFFPIIDRFTGINIIQSVIFSRECNLRRLNFKGFYTVILEETDEFVCIASLRLIGTKMAEMPFVGTRERFRDKGMLQKLLTEIESESAALRQLKVENLVIPSIPELVPMWKLKFGFSEIGSNLMHDLINYNTLMFPSAVRLHKCLVAQAHDEGPPVAVEETNNNETGKGYAKHAFFDLNFEPQEEDDDA